jgi:hypothetical protein
VPGFRPPYATRGPRGGAGMARDTRTKEDASDAPTARGRHGPCATGREWGRCADAAQRSSKHGDLALLDEPVEALLHARRPHRVP